MHDYKPFNSLISNILPQIAYAKHRQLLLITGEQNWCYQQANELLKQLCHPLVKVLSTSGELTDSSWPEHTHQILGQEFQHVIYDGFSGLVPDKFAALSGTVQAGGLFIVLLPELDDLHYWCDPALTAFQSFAQQQQQSYFNQRLARLLQSNLYLHLSQQSGWQTLPETSQLAGKINLTEQQFCIEQIIRTANGRANRPLLISADRGRGKSAALGLAAATLNDKKILICAQQFNALHSCFKHFAAARGLSYQTRDKQLANLHYIAPDQLLNELPDCDVLLVDEAAAIPVPLLIKMLTHYPRIIFASTMVGYEGNGRGYTLKFKRYLEQHYKNMHNVTLEQPIRFAANDPLEQHICNLLALDADYQDITLDTSALLYSELTPQHLAENEALLRQVIGLLALAHYQTSVNDLRHLLDATEQRIFVCQQQGVIIAVCLIAIEGGLTADLSQQVVSGQRRPQGHLMAQTLAQLSANADVLTRLCARVVRIAVAPSQHSKCIGSQLIAHCEQQLASSCDWFGASFGANASLLKFWQMAGFSLVKLGFMQDKATAEHAALVAKSLTDRSSLIKNLKTDFQSDFALQLLDHFNQLDQQLVEQVLRDCAQHNADNIQDTRLAALLTTDYQIFTIKPLLWRTLWCTPSSLSNCDENTKCLFIRLILQNWSSQKAQIVLQIRGKKSLDKLFKQAVTNWYEQYLLKKLP
ncbi:GNAT family N-acetyltransferase [Pseudoalteromonas sp. SR41-4]|uniref:GNAT family N-acetyltransferase n=1 Tax=Pseudoalteromonas sp. SR41-4 TaxID=2760950 RepID=UPI00160290AB|nr:GNAT family N-acetyltransferase [Pseudoalteromonas sp. SR41-4]MBB1294181.1 tRNA(Met) cytidine acetyltransferase [Pseudoalteromonas sp. SR41-4]